MYIYICVLLRGTLTTDPILIIEVQQITNNDPDGMAI